MYLAPPSGRAQCMTLCWLFCSQIVQLLSGKLNQHSELVPERSTVAINTGVLCNKVSDPEPAVFHSWPRQPSSTVRYKRTKQSEVCALCLRERMLLMPHTAGLPTDDPHFPNCLNILSPQWLRNRHLLTFS